ncbi:hypothetical protein AOC36_11540 [Erysipelothrix larvae]|uniref:Carbohydrate kinase PfkB domain-containing protein n=1 Tax=Erysipelothrix larvae TaxID=1514105 RepID=A0A0X8H1Y2_9FIRM|nr:sugar kinase [Erysipelothrix larvae]AMC94582.1 hypothetical protein AOC36_11540 [Erysipelothrix larvae]
MRIVAFGETMLRLSTQNNKALSQSQALDMLFCGTGVNLLRNLYQFGHEVSLISSVPDNDIGIAALSNLRMLGINEQAVTKSGNHIGIYFLEPGHGLRPSKVTYMNRSFSSFNTYQFTQEELRQALSGADLVHICGISCQTSVISRNNALLVASLCESMSIKLCFDFNFRQSLMDPNEYDTVLDAFKYILKRSTIVFGSVLDLEKTLQIEGSTFEERTLNFMNQYTVDVFSGTLKTLDHNDQLVIKGFLCKDSVFKSGKPIAVDVLDAIGTGDAYASGIISGLQSGWPIQEVIDFATRCCAVAYTTVGDYLNVTQEEILRMNPSKAQRVLR